MPQRRVRFKHSALTLTRPAPMCRGMEQPALDLTIHVRLTPELAAGLRRMAAEQERSVSVLVRRALRDVVLRQAATSQERAA
jgi:Ribbon-helix-helix protein, copG family